MSICQHFKLGIVFALQEIKLKLCLQVKSMFQ